MKKLIPKDFLNPYRHPALVLMTLFLFILNACQIDENELGLDILPPGDNIIVFYDTLSSMTTRTVTGFVFNSSENRSDSESQANRRYLLGSTRDTITGFTKADIVTQFSPTLGFKYAENTLIDSVVLYLYFDETNADRFKSNLHIKIHELTERISIDESYYSDYDIEGKYDPDPLVEKVFRPVDTTLFEFLITDQDFINKFIYPDSGGLFYQDSLFKDYFNGFYITSEEISGEPGSMSRIHLAKSLSRLSIKYANDSTAVDTIPGPVYQWANFTINEFNTQKINIFHHDYTGTYLGSIVDNESLQPDVAYVQGLSGVSTLIRLNGVDQWKDSGVVSILNAQLIFEILPDSSSGIKLDDLPERMVLLTRSENGDIQRMYDEYVDNIRYDGHLKAVSEGVYFDTTYIYRFNIGLHYQSIINGDIDNYDLLLKPYYYGTDYRIVKLWSNYSNRKGRLKLRIVYTKL